jgi:hypothetical protein
MSRADSEGLSLAYRILYRIRYAGLMLYGPAQLGSESDPVVRLERERAAKVEAARRARLEGKARGRGQGRG